MCVLSPRVPRISCCWPGWVRGFVSRFVSHLNGLILPQYQCTSSKILLPTSLDKFCLGILFLSPALMAFPERYGSVRRSSCWFLSTALSPLTLITLLELIYLTFSRLFWFFRTPLELFRLDFCSVLTFVPPTVLHFFFWM